MSRITIGELARRAGVGVETIRFYERRELISEPARHQATGSTTNATCVGCSLFDGPKGLGLHSAKLPTYLDLSVEPGASCMDVERKAESTIDRIDGQVRELRRMKKTLVSLTRARQERRPTGDCPILETLGD